MKWADLMFAMPGLLMFAFLIIGSAIADHFEDKKKRNGEKK